MSTYAPAPTTHERLLAWVEEVAALAEPDRIHWCDGSAEEYDALCVQLVEAGTFTRLSDARRPNSYLALSDPGDVARVEDRTFICSLSEDDAGPTNNWRDPTEMREVLSELFEGSMKGRTMYVVPFSMGPLGSDKSYVGVQLTDSTYVAVSMRIMTRMGQAALEALGSQGEDLQVFFCTPLRPVFFPQRIVRKPKPACWKQILAVAIGYDLNADGNASHQSGGDGQPRKAHKGNSDLRQLRAPHPRKRGVIAGIELIGERQFGGDRHQPLHGHRFRRTLPCSRPDSRSLRSPGANHRLPDRSEKGH